MTAEWLLQYTETYATEAGARESFRFLSEQVDYQGGRVLAPSAAKPGWRVQVFFTDAPGPWYPDGIRRVQVTPGLRRTLGLLSRGGAVRSA